MIRAPAVDHLVDAVCQEHLFSLELDPGMEDCRISCCYRRLRGRNVKISKASYFMVSEATDDSTLLSPIFSVASSSNFLQHPTW